MSAEVILRCDGMKGYCDRKYIVETLHSSAMRARLSASRQGWVNVEDDGGSVRDYCSECAIEEASHG